MQTAICKLQSSERRSWHARRPERRVRSHAMTPAPKTPKPKEEYQAALFRLGVQLPLTKATVAELEKL